MSLGQPAREGEEACDALKPGDLPELSTGDSLHASRSATGAAAISGSRGFGRTG